MNTQGNSHRPVSGLNPPQGGSSKAAKFVSGGVGLRPAHCGVFLLLLVVAIATLSPNGSSSSSSNQVRDSGHGSNERPVRETVHNRAGVPSPVSCVSYTEVVYVLCQHMAPLIVVKLAFSPCLHLARAQSYSVTALLHARSSLQHPRVAHRLFFSRSPLFADFSLWTWT